MRGIKMVTDRHDTCQNCSHPIYGYKVPYSHLWHFEHYRIKEGQKHGTTSIKCFLCDCKNAEPLLKQVLQIDEALSEKFKSERDVK